MRPCLGGTKDMSNEFYFLNIDGDYYNMNSQVYDQRWKIFSLLQSNRFFDHFI